MIVGLNSSTAIADAGSDLVVCAGGSVILDGSGSSAGSNFTYSWEPTASLNDPTSQTPEASPSQTTEYVLTVTNTDDGCTDTDTVLVVFQPPIPPTVVEDTICPGEIYVFAGDTLAPGFYQYVLQSANGCDSTVDLALIEFDPDITFWAEDYSPGENESFCVGVKAKDFVDILCMQYSIYFNDAQLQFDSVSNFNLPGLDANNFANVSNGVLTFAWCDAPPFDGETLPDSTIVYEICFTATGLAGDDSLIDFGEVPTFIEIIDINFNELTYKFLAGEIIIVPPSLPPCALLTDPLNGSTDVPIDNQLTWEDFPNTNGYFLSIGTTPSGTDILDNEDVGNATTYDPGILSANSTIYVNITPYNSTGSAIGCQEESFATGECPAFNGVNWVGATGLWTNPINWDVGSLPVPCSEVEIMTGDVFMLNGFSGTARTLEVAQGASLEVQLGAELTVE